MNVESHERIEEMLAARALGGLSPAEEGELDRLRAEHGLDCEECLRIEAGYREVAGRLAFALDPAPVREGLEEELMDRASGAAARPSDRPRWARRVAAMAAAAAILVAGGVGGYLLGRSESPSDVRALASFVAQEDTKVVPFTGPGNGSLKVAFRPGDPSGFVFGSGLPEAPSGRLYELWTFHGERPVASGTFEGGDDVVVVRVTTRPATASALAVTVERTPGAKQPTTKPIFTASIG